MKNILLILLLQSLIISGCNQIQNRDNQTSGSLVNKTEHIDSSNSIIKTDIISNLTQATDSTIPTEHIISRTPLPPDTKFRILPVGKVTGDIPLNAENLNWIALYRDGSKSYLKKVKPKLIESDSTHPVDFLEITVENNHQCLLLINANGLEEGEVPSLRVRKPKPRSGDTLSFIYKALHYKLNITGSPCSMDDFPHENAIDNYKMTIKISQKNEDITQNIIDYQGTTHEWYLPSIIWAGDIDADDKLDLIIDKPGHYGSGRIELYLSTKTDNSELLKSAAVFQIWGC